MIKVLVVDDDKLARKGLISAFPWSSFDMEVVGEANNGEKALEFLSSNSVDLLLVDLAMPVMSGIELMKIVRQMYPNIYFVVLTFHQDFEYIQEALRIGAIDYISKLQLEKERFEEVLGRIHDRIMQERNKTLLAECHERALRPIDSDTGYVMVSIDEHADMDWFKEITASHNISFDEIGNGMWKIFDLCDMNSESVYKIFSQELSKRDKFTLLELTGIQGENRSVVNRLLRRSRQRAFFYEYDPEIKFMLKSVNEIHDESNVLLEEGFQLLKNQWLSCIWTQRNDIFEQLLGELRKARLPIVKLHDLLVGIVNEWNRIYSSFTPFVVETPELASSWLEVTDWFNKVRELTMKATARSKYSSDVTDCIMKALKIVNDEMGQQIFAVDVAKRVNMSRSYFNQCFKDIVGRSFNNYLRNVRLEKAKEYLKKTNKTIQWVAEHTGYMDEKYFSQVFREMTGVLPSIYRQRDD